MKYVIIDDGLHVSPFIFPEYIGHYEFVTKMKHYVTDVMSAGFVDLDANGKVWASGHSIELQLSAKPEDTEFIRRCLGYTDAIKEEEQI